MINEPIKCNLGNGPVDFGMSGRTGHDLWLHVIGVETSAIMGQANGPWPIITRNFGNCPIDEPIKNDW